MDKLHLIRRLAELHPQLGPGQAEHSVRAILDALCRALAKGGRVEIRGFGSFSLNKKQTEQKRGPRVAGKLNAPAKYAPHFKPSRELCARVSNGNGTGIAAVCPPQPISPDPFDRDAANDTEPTGIYA